MNATPLVWPVVEGKRGMYRHLNQLTIRLSYAPFFAHMPLPLFDTPGPSQCILYNWYHEYIGLITDGLLWSSGLVHRICVLMAESSEFGFESWLRPWCLCPSARHFTIISSLHPGVNGYLWAQSWLLCLISPMRQNGSNWAVHSPGSWDGYKNDLCAWWAGIIMYSALI